MLTPLSKLILIAVAGIVALALIVLRIVKWRRQRSATETGRPPARTQELTTGAAPSPAAAPLPPPAAPTSAPAKPGAGSTVSPAPVLHTAASRPALGLRGDQRATDALPHLRRLEPDEVPTAGTADYTFGILTPVLAALLPESAERARVLKQVLRNAGYYNPHAYHNLSAIRYVGIVLPILFFGALMVVGPPELEPWMMGGIVLGGILGWSVPGLLVRSRAAERLGEIERGMPDMLDILNMCVSQGMTVSGALHRVGRELQPVYPALAKELRIVTEHARVGHLEQALANFAERVNVPEVHSFASLLIQTERMGTSVSDALTEYSDSMRETLRQRADEKANSAAFKLLFPTVLCLMPAVYLFLLGPAIIELSKFFNEGGRNVLDVNLRAARVTQER